jgi:hypothetical protein
LNIKIEEGERKEESARLGLSMQDVFSDSANLEGMQQKTSAQSETGQRKRAQLERKGVIKSNRNAKGGRRKLLQGQKIPYKLNKIYPESPQEHIR